MLDRPPARRLVPAAGLAAATLLFALSPVWWPPAGGDAEYRHSTMERLAADSYLLAGIACLAAVAVALALRTRPPEQPAQPPRWEPVASWAGTHRALVRSERVLAQAQPARPGRTTRPPALG
jgi:hypothetical protein